jgi:hypothetical protein
MERSGDYMGSGAGLHYQLSQDDIKMHKRARTDFQPACAIYVAFGLEFWGVSGSPRLQAVVC